MTLGEKIRLHVLARHLQPAIEKGLSQITLRAGDIHGEMRLSARMPSVCNAMAGRKLLESAGVTLKSRTGPRNGANVFFAYEITDCAGPSCAANDARSASLLARPLTSLSTSPISVDFRNALSLVSCAKSKLGHPAAASELYARSNSFRLARSLILRNKGEWRILSAKHGLVAPASVIAPYELTLNTMRNADRRRWAEKVLEELLPLARQYDRTIFFAGMRYREFLEPTLRRKGIDVAVPMEGLRQGEQLAWLSRA